MKKQLKLFLLSLSFLTRMGPAMAADGASMSSACLYYPFVGLVLGCILTLPFYCGLLAGYPWLQAWLYLIFSAWLTRALHLDGVADLSDALGSGKQGEAFFAILKDSRLGAFGAVGLFFCLGGQLLCLSAHFERLSLAPLLYAPLFGRSLPIVLSVIAPAHPDASLGKLLANAPKNASLGLALCAVFLGGLLCLPSIANLGLVLGLGAILLFWLARIAKHGGGYNGDFFGAAIAGGELAALLGSLLPSA